MQIRSAHSWKSVVCQGQLHLSCWVWKCKNFICGGWTKLKLFICIGDALQIVVTIRSTNVAGKFWTNGGKVILKFIPFYRRNRSSVSRFSRSKFIDSPPSLSGIDFVFVKTILIIGLLCYSLWCVVLFCFLNCIQSKGSLLRSDSLSF